MFTIEVITIKPYTKDHNCHGDHIKLHQNLSHALDKQKKNKSNIISEATSRKSGRSSHVYLHVIYHQHPQTDILQNISLKSCPNSMLLSRDFLKTKQPAPKPLMPLEKQKLRALLPMAFAMVAYVQYKYTQPNARKGRQSPPSNHIIPSQAVAQVTHQTRSNPFEFHTSKHSLSAENQAFACCLFLGLVVFFFELCLPAPLSPLIYFNNSSTLF
jgi:hypothetical protein